jgi:hypothetical protein
MLRVILLPRFAGADKPPRSRDAIAPEFCQRQVQKSANPIPSDGAGGGFRLPS